MSSLAQRCRDLIVDLKLGRESDAVSAAPLAGGVSSDIARVEIGGACYCAKFALEKLKVDAEWRAPVRRNAAEYRWLEFVGTIAPESVPRLYGRSEKCNGFVMEFLGASDVRNWKNTLLQRGPGDGEAQAVGALLGRIHGASAAPAFDRAAFRNHEDFWALRLEPYLQNMIAKHPDLAVPLHGLIARYRDAECALIHGDVSPKNILFRGCVPVLLDAECATMGDPSFDVAFCLNHFVLKGVHLAPYRDGFLEACHVFWSAYRVHVTWEAPEAMESRVAALLPALMLARVDGKSPVEYLSPAEQEAVRALAGPLILKPRKRLCGLLDEMRAQWP